MTNDYLKLYVKYLINICEDNQSTDSWTYKQLKVFYENGCIKGYIDKNDNLKFKTEQISYIAYAMNNKFDKNVMTYKEFRTYYLLNDM